MCGRQDRNNCDMGSSTSGVQCESRGSAFLRFRHWFVQTLTVRSRLPDFKPIWHQDRKRPEQCPVCGHRGDFPLLLDIASVVRPHPQITFAACPTCRTIIQLEFKQPRYESNHGLSISRDVYLKFYVEQGAGLETLVTPAFIARDSNASRYLEIGCGLGFGLDFAGRTFGWQVRGIDPSWMARQGRRLLGVKIESRYLTATEGAVETSDAIAAIEVLEHIEKPYEFLAGLTRQSQPDRPSNHHNSECRIHRIWPRDPWIARCVITGLPRRPIYAEKS